jgi:hypothetical protein
MTTVSVPISESAMRQLGKRASERGIAIEEFARSILEREAGEVPPDQSAEEWIAEFRAWAASHPHRPLSVDDSRESIY